MHLSPDQIILIQKGAFKINGTLVYTWLVMALLVFGSRLLSSRLTSSLKPSKFQAIVEVIILGIQKQIEDVGLKSSGKYLAFLGTLFLSIGTAHLCTIFPFYKTPTSSLSTTAALAICVFIAVPFYGISEQGLMGYFKSYLKPTPFMFPFHVISEFSRTLALAIRLFGNMMSGEMILGILLVITPLFFPVVMSALGLLTGMVQAYIFSILACVYIAAATRGHGD